MTDLNSTNNAQTITDAEFEVRRASGRKKLLLIFGLFAVPLLLATLWFHAVRISGGSWGNTAKGELITPAVPLEGMALTENGQLFDIDGLRGKWTILYVPESLQCGEDCGEHLMLIRQLRLALNHRMERVQRVVLLDQSTVPEAMQEAQLGLRVVSGSDAQRKAFLAQLSQPTQGLEPVANPIYIVDPFGNLMMRFGPEQLPDQVHKDLKRLLKASRIG